MSNDRPDPDNLLSYANPLTRVVRTPCGPVRMTALPGRLVRIEPAQTRSSPVMSPRPVPLRLEGFHVAATAMADARSSPVEIGDLTVIDAGAGSLGGARYRIEEAARLFLSRVVAHTVLHHPNWLVEADLVEIYRRRRDRDALIADVESEIERRFEKLDRLLREKTEEEAGLDAREAELRAELGLDGAGQRVA